MSTKSRHRKRFTFYRSWWQSIAFRVALLSWILIIVTLGIYMSTLLPYIRKSAIDSMKSEAKNIAASIGSVTANAIILEDYSFAVLVLVSLWTLPAEDRNSA